MGKVTATIRVSNLVDHLRSQAHELAAEDVRTEVLADVMVDTGATLLCLPADVIRRLGLTSFLSRRLVTATGTTRARMYEGVRLEIEGRPGTFDCVELPEGSPALLGVVPLEVLGIELDLQNRRLILLPEDDSHSYLTAL